MPGHAPKPTDSEWRRYEAVLERFEAAWQSDEPPRIADFLPPPEDRGRRHLLHELVRTDLEYRSGRGEQLGLEDYVAQFPEMKDTAGTSGGATPVTLAWPAGSTADFGTSPAVPLPASFGRYELREQVGRGGFATVFRAWDPELARVVAIKVPRFESVGDADLHMRVLREARSAAQLHHPAIVPIHQVGDASGYPYIVYEFISGPTLAALLKEQRPDPHQAATWVMRVAQALDYAHSCGIIHRDVKPANIMLGRDGEPLVADFGLALQISDAATLTVEGDILGTPAYMSPEQAQGLGHAADARSDVYSLGVVLYESLCGRPPFEGSPVSILHKVIHEEPPPPRNVLRGVPPDLETICLKAMAKEPARRYATAGAMAEDLRRYLHHEPILARRMGPFGRLTLWCRRNPALAATIAVALVALMTLGIVSYRRVVRERDRYLAERETAVSNLYLSLVREVRSIRLARRAGYRAVAWDRIWQAMVLDTPARDPDALRQEAVACLGDFVGDEPATWIDFPEAQPWSASLAFDPSGRFLALAFRDGRIQLRETATGRIATELREHARGPFAMAFSADGRTLASMDDAGVINVWHATAGAGESWTLNRQIQGLVGVERDEIVAVSCVLTPDGQHVLACAKGEQRVRIWNVATGEVEHEFGGENDEPFVRATISPDGQTLVGAYRTAVIDGVVIWDVGQRRLVKNLPVTRQAIVDVAFSGDGAFLACACTDGTYVFDTTNWNQRTIVRSDDQFFTVAFHPHQPILAVPTMRTGTVRLWDVIGNREVATLEHPAPRCVAFSPDGSYLASAADLSFRLWNLRGGGERREIAAHRGTVNRVMFSPNGQLLASASDDTRIKLWDAATARQLSEFSVSSSPLGKVASLAFSPDGDHLAAVDWSGAAAIFDVTAPESPSRLTTLLDAEHPELGNILTDVTFSSNGQYVAVAGVIGARVWRGQQGQNSFAQPQLFATPTSEYLIALQFSPDSRRLVWQQHNQGFVGVWNLESGQPEPIALQVPASLAFIGKPGHLLHMSGLTEPHGAPLLRITDPKTSQSSVLYWPRVPAIVEDLGLSNRFALSRDQQWLALMGTSVAVWDLRARRLVVALAPEASPVNTLAWSPDRAQLALGRTDGTIAIWNLPEVRSQLATIGLDW